MKISTSQYQQVENLMRSDDLGSLKKFLESGMDVNETLSTDAGGGTRTLLLMAAERGAVRITVYLLSLGADPNKASYIGVTPLYMCAYCGDAETAKILLAYGARKDFTKTIEACVHEANSKLTQLMISFLWPIDPMFCDLNTLLHHAAYGRDEHHNPEQAQRAIEVFWTLLCAGANPSAKSKDGDTVAKFLRMRSRVDRGFSLCPTYRELVRRSRLTWCKPLYRMLSNRPVEYHPSTFSTPLRVPLSHFNPRETYARMLAELAAKKMHLDDPLGVLGPSIKHRADYRKVWDRNNGEGRIAAYAEILLRGIID